MFNSKWICDKTFEQAKPINVFHKELTPLDIPKSEVFNHHVYFYKRFLFGGKNAVINISADDYYKLYINGKFVCQGPAPAYPTEYNYNSADISEYLKQGENEILVHVYYQGYINRVWNSGDMRFGLIADVFFDGEYAFGTDKTWGYREAKEYSECGTVGYETQFLERIDASKREVNFRNKIPEELFLPAVEKVGDDHTFKEEAVSTLDVYEVLPVKTVTLGKGHIFIDFGKEYAGQLYFEAQGKRGEEIAVMCGEELEGENKVRHALRCNCDYVDYAVLSGGKDEFDFYDYKAFRYAELKSENDVVDTGSIKFIVRNWKFDDNACVLESENKLLQDIFGLCKQGVKVGSQEVFVDCPTREKGQYLGDFMATGLSSLYLTGDTELFRKALRDFADSEVISSGMMATAPGSFMQEIADFSLLYPEELLNYYDYTKDAETVKKFLPAAKSIIEYFKQYEQEDGLLGQVEEKWNLVDWPMNLRDDYETGEKGKEGRHNVINAYYINAMQAVNRLCEIAGLPVIYDTEKAKRTFMKEFFCEETGLFVDRKGSKHSALHSNALPLYAGIVPDDKKQKILDFCYEKGLCCGVMFAYFVLRCFAKAGDFKREYELLVNESEHSWANMLREGATTCFEAWGKDQKWNTSLCHPWASSPISVIISDLLGFETDGEKVTFNPKEGLPKMKLKITYKGKEYICEN